MKSDQMGTRTAQPSPQELLLSNWTRFCGPLLRATSLRHRTAASTPARSAGTSNNPPGKMADRELLRDGFSRRKPAHAPWPTPSHPADRQHPPDGVNALTLGRLVAQARAPVVERQDREAPNEPLHKEESGHAAPCRGSGEAGACARHLILKHHTFGGQMGQCR